MFSNNLIANLITNISFLCLQIVDMPMGQLPILEIDNKTYHQSRAIARFIAKKGNLYGSDEFEAMEIDATVDSMEDIRRGKSIDQSKNDRLVIN